MMVEIEAGLGWYRICAGSILVADDVPVAAFEADAFRAALLDAQIVEVPFHLVIRQAHLGKKPAEGA